MFKKVLTTTVVGVSVLSAMVANATDSSEMSANSAVPGIYVTGQMGYANNSIEFKTPDDKVSNNDISKSGLGGRVAIGYQCNPNFALELGYFQAAQKKITLIDASEDHIVAGHVALNQNAIDLLAKGIVPVRSNLNVYGKLGVAYVTTDFTLDSDSEKFNPMVEYVAKRKWAPEVAVGVSYDIAPNVSLDTSWTHIQPLGRNTPGNIDFVAVGLGYQFG